MGAAGDMLAASLLSLLSENERNSFLDNLNQSISALGDVRAELIPHTLSGISGFRFKVSINGAEEDESMHDHDHHHHKEQHHDDDHEHHHHHHDEHVHHHHEEAHHCHADLRSVFDKIDSLKLSEAATAASKMVYAKLAEAEATAHGRPIEHVHFHEVGELDAIVDITTVCALIDYLKLDRISASHIELGGGFVKCAHGILPVPAPATAHLLRGVPITADAEQTELCTPTGAALLSSFAESFGAIPNGFITDSTGYGFGKKEFKRLNAVRAMLGSVAEERPTDGSNDSICELICNLDDMTGETIAFACNRLFEAGALDVFTQPIYMKKSRPAVMLTVLCGADDKDKFAALMLKHTTSFGVRVKTCARYILGRSFSNADTCYGTVRVKTGSGYGVTKAKVEFEDASRLAVQLGINVTDVIREAEGIR
jgi:uncharacterized protein (TIGR00299 family) protein